MSKVESISNYTIYPIFLSSLCTELITLRERIYIEVGKSSKIYVDEKIKNRNITNQDDLECADELIQRIREAHTFICVLGGKRHGSSIKIGKSSSSVSFFEIELFQAALLQKDIYLFVRNDFDPEPRLRSLLDILKFAFPEWFSAQTKTDNQIIDDIKRLLEKNHRQKSTPFFSIFKSPIYKLVQALFTARARKINLPILFLGNQFDARSNNINYNILTEIVHMIKRESNEEKRLSRLWIALRELMCIPYIDLKDHVVLSYWNDLLGEWAKAGAWYGLHGDTPLGCLAALNSMVKVRQQLSRESHTQTTYKQFDYPGGALASAKYNIAKRLYIREDRHYRLNEALNDVNFSLQNFHDDKSFHIDDSGLRAIRGSILMKMGKISDAICDYEYVLETRQKRKYPESEIGEALSELGFAYLHQGHMLKGLTYCKEGVVLLNQSIKPGFLVRGLRKLSLAYLFNGRLIKANDTWQETKRLAYQHGIFDQIN